MHEHHVTNGNQYNFETQRYIYLKLLTLSFISTLAPCVIKRVTTSLWPFFAARCKGLLSLCSKHIYIENNFVRHPKRHLLLEKENFSTAIDICKALLLYCIKQFYVNHALTSLIQLWDTRVYQFEVTYSILYIHIGTMCY